MYQVMLLDDEPWELKGLKNMVPWAEYGFTVVEALSNPLEALEHLKSHPIDVLVSDIRMPGLSGIDLLQQLRPLYPDLEILFLSGYAEFEYAQSALRLGAFDYLLKPLDLDTVGELLARLSSRLTEKELESGRKIFDRISDGTLTLADLFPGSEGGCYLAVRAATDLSPFLTACPAIAFRVVKSGSSQFLHFVKCRDQSSAADVMAQLKTHFSGLQMGISLSYDKEDADLNVGVPTLLIRQSAEAFCLRFVTGVVEPCVYSPMNLPALKELMKIMEKRLCGSPSSQTFSIARDLPEYFRTHAISLTGIIWFWNQVLVRFTDQPDLYEEYCIPDVNQLLERFSSADQLGRTLSALLEADAGRRIMKALPGSSEMYHSMIEYVGSHYQEPITLQDVADHLHVSFAYASKLFKKYTDTNYSKYLTSLRLEQAQKLLAATTKTVEEICFEIGYNDYFYFNKTFKKYTGMTPLQYRRQGKRS